MHRSNHSLIALSVQGVLYILVARRTKGIPFAPVLSLVFRDGSYVFMALLAALITIISNNLLSHKFDMAMVYQGSYPVFIAILTSANCHIIRNMEGLSDCCEDESTIEFTSFFFLDENV